MSLTVTALYRYPVKSLRGESLASAEVEPWGLAGDRRWMLVADDGEAITAREHPHILPLTSADIPRLATDREVAVTVHGKGPWSASVAPDDVNHELSRKIGVSARLVHLADPRRREGKPGYSLPGDSVSFADSFPISLATEESLARLNEWIAEGPLAHEGPVPITRFRPNIVVRGAAPFAEDGWRVVRIGEAVFRTPKGSGRCVLTTTDPDTAARGKEPIATLARHRRWEGKTYFATNLIPDTPGTTIRVGDEVEVLDAGDAPDGPTR